MSFPLIWFLLALAVLAVLVKLLIPLCEKYEMAEHQCTLATVQALYLLKNNVKPGVYTFRWQKGEMREPVYEKRDGHEVHFRFIAGNRVSEKIQDMPADFQRQLLALLHAGMRQNKS